MFVRTKNTTLIKTHLSEECIKYPFYRWHTLINFNLAKEHHSKASSFIHRPGQVCFNYLCVPLSPQTSNVDLRSGYIASSVSLALTGGVFGQPDLCGIFPSHGTQLGLR